MSMENENVSGEVEEVAIEQNENADVAHEIDAQDDDEDEDGDDADEDEEED